MCNTLARFAETVGGEDEERGKGVGEGERKGERGRWRKQREKRVAEKY